MFKCDSIFNGRYDYFRDERCSEAIFAIVAKGKYIQGERAMFTAQIFAEDVASPPKGIIRFLFCLVVPACLLQTQSVMEVTRVGVEHT